MTKTTTAIWDPAAHLTTPDDVAAYLEAALQDGVLSWLQLPQTISPGPIA
jgi:DNA-binding phage protein